MLERKSLVELLDDMRERNEAMIKRGDGQRPIRPLLFAKVARTASETISSILKQRCFDYVRVGAKRDIMQFYRLHHRPRISLSHNHVPVASILAGGIMSTENYCQRFRFGGCRNPWDRLVSYWRMKEKNPRLGFAGMAKGCATFADFVEKIDAKKATHSFHPFTSRYHLLQPQWRWLLPDFDAILRYEHLESDWETQMSRVGLTMPLDRQISFHSTPREKRQPYTAYYTYSLSKRVHEMYRSDCEIFGYASMGDQEPYEQSTILSNLRKWWSPYLEGSFEGK